MPATAMKWPKSREWYRLVARLREQKEEGRKRWTERHGPKARPTRANDQVGRKDIPKDQEK